ncbi:MAG: hypothetical protein RL209_1327, partial [Pseudomonadota bacterium]
RCGHIARSLAERVALDHPRRDGHDAGKITRRPLPHQLKQGAASGP